MSLNISGGGHSLGYSELGGDDNDSERPKAAYRSTFSLVDRYAKEFQMEKDRLREVEKDKALKAKHQNQRKDRSSCCMWQYGAVQQGARHLLGYRLADRIFGPGSNS